MIEDVLAGDVHAIAKMISRAEAAKQTEAAPYRGGMRNGKYLVSYQS